MHQQNIVLLGTRGSTPACGREYLIYGGDTACVMVRMGGQTIFLDSGSGLSKAMPYLAPGTDHISVLVSHTHIDHILGLPSFDYMYEPGNRVDIYGLDRDGLDIEAQIHAFLSPPLWPTGAEAFSANIRYRAPSGAFSIGEVSVRTMEGSHPGGATLYRLDHGGKSVVYCTDFEHGTQCSPALADFAHGCDVLLYDAHFTDEEYPDRQGWGHSTAVQGAKAGLASGAGQVVLFHHHPQRTDAGLKTMDRDIQKQYPRCRYGKAQEEVVF